VNKKHLHMGRTAKFAHWSKLLVLPGFGCIGDVVAQTNSKGRHVLLMGRTAKFAHWSKLLVRSGFGVDLDAVWRLCYE
jgi:hypothetical protein